MNSIIYKINNNDLITFISSNTWNEFANENESDHVREEHILNKEIWDFITDQETLEIYKMIVDKVRVTKKKIIVPFRCDSAQFRRLFIMEIEKHDKNSILFHSELQKIEKRISVKLFEHDSKRSEDFIKICSWCKKVEVHPQQEWLEVEEAIISLKLYEMEKLPEITHSICPVCHEKIMKDIA